jgi:hypothetical protein
MQDQGQWPRIAWSRSVAKKLGTHNYIDSGVDSLFFERARADG